MRPTAIKSNPKTRKGALRVIPSGLRAACGKTPEVNDKGALRSWVPQRVRAFGEKTPSSMEDLGALPQTPPSALGRQGVGLKNPTPPPSCSVSGAVQASRVKAPPGLWPPLTPAHLLPGGRLYGAGTPVSRWSPRPERARGFDRRSWRAGARSPGAAGVRR